MMFSVLQQMRWRVLAVYLVVMLTVLVGIGTFVRVQLESRFIANRSRQLQEALFWALTDSEAIGSIIVSDLDMVTQKLATSPAPDFSFYLIDAKGNLIRTLGQGNPSYIQVSPFAPDVENELREGKTVQFVRDAPGDGVRTLVKALPLYNVDNTLIGAIQAEARLDEAERALKTIRLAVFGGFGVAFLMATVVLTIFVLRTSGPLENLARASAAVASGDFAVRLDPPSIHDEVYLAATAFNTMLDTIDKEFTKERETQQRLRQFMTETSHELRSPLTALRGHVDILLRGAKDDAEHLTKSLETMQTILGRTTRLINDLMLLGQLDMNPEIQMENVELNSLCQKILDMAETTAGNRVLRFRGAAPTYCKGDSELLSRLLWNLVDNAVHHTSSEGHITLSLVADGDHCRITVADDGDGISPEHLQRIFEAFYRVNSSRYAGAGLGLTIVKNIAEAHGGQVSVESTVGQGSKFTVTLPL